MKRLMVIAALLLTACGCGPVTNTNPRDAYYKGIQDYCSHVTVIDIATGQAIDRSEAYCENLAADLRAKGFYEKYNVASTTQGQ